MFKKDIRDFMTRQIQTAVDGCATYWAERIADHLMTVGVSITPELAARLDYVPCRCPECGTTAFVEGGMVVDCGICHIGMEQISNELEIGKGENK